MAVIKEGAGGVTDQQSQVTPKQTVEKANIVTQLAPLASQGMKVAQSVFESNKEKEALAGLGSFTANQSKLMEAAKENPDREDEFVTRMNKNLYSYMSKNPHLMAELEKVDNDMRTKAGFGKEVFEDSPEEKAWNADLEEGVKTGLVDPNASDETQKLQVASFRKTKATVYNANVSKAEYVEQQLAYQKIADKASSEATVAKAALDKKRTEFTGRVAEVAHSSLASYEAASAKIIDQWNSGAMNQATATIALEQLYASADAEILGFSSDGATDEQVKAILAPVKTMRDIYIKALGQEMDLNELNKQIAIPQQKALLNTLNSNPQMLLVTSLAKALGPAFDQVSGAFPKTWQKLNSDLETLDLQITPAGGDTVLGGIKLPEGQRKAAVTRADVKNTVQDVTALVAGANTVGTTEAQREGHSYLDKAFQGVDVYAQGVADPVANKGLLEILADKNTGKLLADTGGFLNADTAAKVTLLMEQQFLQPISKVVADHWQKGHTFKAAPSFSGGMEMPISIARDTAEVKPYSQLAKPVFKGGQLTFVGMGSGHPQERMAVMELNNKVRPQVQLIIQGAAHVEASTDYQAAYDLIAPTLFPDIFQFDGVTGADNKRNPRSAPEPEVAEATIEADYDTLEVGTQVVNEAGEVFEYVGGDINALASYKPVGG